MKFSLILFLFILISITTNAKVHVGVVYGGMNDSNTLDSKNVTSTTYASGYVYFSVLKKSGLYVGAEYSYFSASGPNAASTYYQLQTSNPLFGIKWMLGREELFFVSASFTPLSQSVYKVTGALTETWTGSAIVGQFGLRPLISEHLRLVAEIAYVSSTYNTKAVSSNGTPSSTKSSFSSSYYSPAIGLEYNF